MIFFCFFDIPACNCKMRLIINLYDKVTFVVSLVLLHIINKFNNLLTDIYQRPLDNSFLGMFTQNFKAGARIFKNYYFCNGLVLLVILYEFYKYSKTEYLNLCLLPLHSFYIL